MISLRLRITKVDEYQFLTCLKTALWGSKSARFRDWQENDYLVFIVDKAVAGFAVVSGKPFHSTDMIWDNGLFPYRIPIKFTHILTKDNRVPILGDVREVLTSTWGPNYGWGILTQNIIEGKQAETLIKTISEQPNNLTQIQSGLDLLLGAAKQARKNQTKKPKITKKAQYKKLTDNMVETQTDKETSCHSQAEYALVRLGKATGCSVYVASNDRGKTIQGKQLGEECLRNLPNFGLNEEAVRKISLIDVIWILRNSPICAFEVETTTSIFSGLLRMSDLLSVVPSLKISLYIVAPKDREDKVRAEITRPTFQKIGLNEYCKFIPLEELNKLFSRVEGLQGHIQPTIIDTIAKSFENQELI